MPEAGHHRDGRWQLYMSRGEASSLVRAVSVYIEANFVSVYRQGDRSWLGPQKLNF